MLTKETFLVSIVKDDNGNVIDFNFSMPGGRIKFSDIKVIEDCAKAKNESISNSIARNKLNVNSLYLIRGGGKADFYYISKIEDEKVYAKRVKKKRASYKNEYTIESNIEIIVLQPRLLVPVSGNPSVIELKDPVIRKMKM